MKKKTQELLILGAMGAMVTGTFVVLLEKRSALKKDLADMHAEEREHLAAIHYAHGRLVEKVQHGDYDSGPCVQQMQDDFEFFKMSYLEKE